MLIAIVSRERAWRGGGSRPSRSPLRTVERSPAPGSTAAAPDPRAVGSRTPTRWSRSPPRPIRAPRCSAGPGRAPGRLGADVRRAAARHEDGLGRVRLPRRRRASGERRRHRHLDTRTSRLRNDLRGSVRRRVDGDPHRGGGLRVDVRRLERCVLRHRPGLFVPGVVAHRRGGDVPVRRERGGGRRRRGLRVGSLDRRARGRRLLPLGASGRRLGDLRVLRRRGDALHGLGSLDGQGADPDRRGVDGHDRRLRAGHHHAGEASLRGSRARSARPDGGGARDEAPRRRRGPGSRWTRCGGAARPAPILPRRRSGGRARRMPPPAAARTRSATPGTRPPSSRSRGPACRSARCADRRWAGRRSGWTARS